MKTVLFFLVILSTLGCQKEVEYSPFQYYLNGLQKAKEINKPIFLHFTCWGCIGDNKFQNKVLPHPKVKRLLANDFVSIELYVDDRQKMNPKKIESILSKIPFSDSSKTKIWKSKTLGALNSEIEKTLFQKENQPLFVLLDADAKMLVKPFEYFGDDIDFFVQKLEEAKSRIN